MMARNFLLGTLSLCLLLCVAPVAHAQLWLEPAYSEHPLLGPAKAEGAVIWSHGRSVDSEDSKAPTPPYMATLRDGKWDAFRFNRMRRSDTLAASAEGLVEQVHKLKQQGYRRVALAGQSFGAFLALMAADASNEVDAVVATAPAAYGSFHDFYDSWRSNATKLYPLLEQVQRARVIVFYFHGDDFDPGGRGDRSRAILSAQKLPFVVVDQPPQFTSHWAASTPQFARAFGGCILGFLEAQQIVDGARCESDAFWAGSSESSLPAHPGVASATSQGTAARSFNRH